MDRYRQPRFMAETVRRSATAGLVILASSGLLTGTSLAQLRPAGPPGGPAPDFRERMVEDFEAGGLGHVNTDVQRAVVEMPSDKASRNKGCLKLNLSPDEPLRLTFDILADQLVEYDWLEYDVVGATPGSVLIEAFGASFDEETTPLAGAVVDRPKWTGQILLAEFAERGQAGADLHAELRFTAVAKPSAVYLDALRLVRDRPPDVPPEVGGAFAFGRGRIVWPGFTAVDAQTVRQTQDLWMWDSLVAPQISQLGWPDPLQRQVLTSGSISRRESVYALTLQLRPGNYEGVILAAPISTDGLVRPAFDLRCNGVVLTGREWPIERMFTEDAIFFGRRQRDFSADLVRERWVDPAFLELPFRAAAPNGLIVIQSNGVALGGLVVYPASLGKAFAPYLERQRKRRQAYFAQQTYACVHPLPARPPDQPNDGETKAGAMLLTAGLMQLLDEHLLSGAARSLRDRFKLSALPGQVLSVPLGVYALEDLESVSVDVEKGRSGSVRISEVREFPMHWRGPVRRAVPLWLDQDEARDINAGRVVWYLIELGIPRSARGSSAKYRVSVQAHDHAALRLELEVDLARVRSQQGWPSVSVIYPDDWESGYLFDLFGAPPDTDVGKLVLDDYRVLGDYGAAATIIRGMSIGGSVDEPRVHVARAAIRARFASRAGMNAETPGLIDFTSITTNHHWVNGPSPMLAGAAADAFRRLRGNLHRANADVTAVIASRLTPRDGLNQLQAPSTIELANMLKGVGYGRLGVVLDADRWRLVAGDADAGLGEMMPILGSLDHVVAPLSPARALRRKHKDLRVDLLEPLGGRFGAGYMRWLEKLDGVWIGRVHRRTVPFQPIVSARENDLPLIIPSRGQPAPTLRLVALREGTTDLAYVRALTERLERRRRNDAEKFDAAKKSLETLRENLLRAWDEAIQADFDRPLNRRTGQPAAPPTDVLDRTREDLLARLVELSGRR